MESVMALLKRWGRVPQFTAALAAIGTALLVWGEVRSWRADRPEISAPRYLVARRGLAEGESIQWSDFSLTSEQGDAASDTVTDQDLVWLKGGRLLRAVGSGERLRLSAVELPREAGPLGRRVPLGLRAHVVPNENRLPLRVGDRVDLQVVNDGQGQLVLVEGAVVLQNMGEHVDEAVVALGADEIALVEKGRRSGKLILSLRHPEEALPGRKRRARSSKRRAPHRIEIWTEES